MSDYIHERNMPIYKTITHYNLGLDYKNVAKCNELIRQITKDFQKQHKGRNPDVDILLSFPPYQYDKERLNFSQPTAAPCEVAVRFMSKEGDSAADWNWVEQWAKNNKIKPKYE